MTHLPPDETMTRQPSNTGLAKLVEGRLKRRIPVAKGVQDDPADRFAPSLFGLARAPFFAALSDNRQRDILRHCANGLIAEAYAIESAGISYCARMVLEAESVEERQLYALIGGDEAAHMAWLGPFGRHMTDQTTENPFLGFLSDIIDNAPGPVAVALLQVILEGWGLKHYRRMADNCRLPELEAVFRNILKDEALHHRAGEVLMKPRLLETAHRAELLERLALFLSMVRAGPLSVLTAVDRVRGGLLDAELITVYEALDGRTSTQQRLNELRGLMRMEGLGWAVTALSEKGLFEPATPHETARHLRAAS